MITIISATNRAQSNARIISDIYAGLLQQHGMASQVLDLIDLPADFVFTALYENCGQNPEFNRLNALIGQSDKFVFIIPEYNGSYPGVLKAFIDGLQFPNTFRNKKAALVGISTGTQGAALALSHLTDVLNYLGMHVLAAKPRLMHIHKNMTDKTITNPLYLDLLQQQISQFLTF